MDHVGNGEIVEAHLAQPLDMLRPEADRGRGQRRRGGDDGVPARIEIGADAVIEKALHIVVALGVMRGEACMHRGAEDAAIQARGRGRRKLALGAR